MRGVLRLNVRNLETGALSRHDLDEPYALLGRGPECHVQLDDDGVRRRHVYLQVLHGCLHCFDLGGPPGIYFWDGLRNEGLLSGTESLIIGPFQVRLSQAPAYRLYSTGECGPGFENPPSGEAHLAFRNAHDGSSREVVRPLRERVTLVGRSARCHVRLADQSVGSVHAAIVHTPVGHWFVNLRPDKSSRVDGKSVLCEPLPKEAPLEIGRFQMRFCTGPRAGATGPAASDVPASTQQTPADVPQESALVPATTDNGLTVDPDGRSGLSEHVLLAVVEQFGRMQQQLLNQTHQQTMMLARVMAGMQEQQQSAIYDQLARIQAITDELAALQRPRLELDPLVQSNTSETSEVIDRGRSERDMEEIDVEAVPASKSGAASHKLGGRSPTARKPKGAADRVEAYQRVTRRIHELERERTRGWQKVMSLLGVGEGVN